MSDRKDAPHLKLATTPKARRDVVVLRGPTPRSDAVREYRLKKVANLNREKTIDAPLLADGTGS